MNRNSGVDPALAVLLKRAESKVLDYGFVMDCLQDYRAPRVKLKHLLDIGALIRVKKGLYVFGKLFARGPHCLEVLANLVYGPSYVSLEWACQYYRLIPERVEVVTSVTMGRRRQFKTPLKLFTYDHLHPNAYAVGISQISFEENCRALIATKEKALADLLVLRRGRCRSLLQMKETLYEDLRIESEDLVDCDLERLERIHRSHPHSAVHYLTAVVKEEKSHYE